MGLFDEVLSMAGLGGSASTGQHTSAMSAILEYINSPQVGGVTGLQQMFRDKGLGGLISAWISNGPNPAISQDQLQNVVHGGALEAAASKFGIDPSQLLPMMSKLLPHVVDRLTPDGQIPAARAAHP